jgi:hypothetical protein
MAPNACGSISETTEERESQAGGPVFIEHAGRAVRQSEVTADADFPAAHSMDTLWFAVDKDGRVAALQSDSGGAAPAARPRLTGDDQEQLCERLRELLPQSPVTYDLAGRITPGPLHQGTDHYAEDMKRPEESLLFLSSLDPVAQEIAGGTAVQHPATEGWAVLFTRLLPELARRVHQAGACLACFSHSPYSDLYDLAECGFFSYKHLLGDWLPGPYGRQRVPMRPVHIDQLPPDLRKAIGRVRFEGLSFAQTVHLQPAEHMACEAIEAGYLTADGAAVRPLPGQDAEYRVFLQELLSEAPPGTASSLRIERPPVKRRKRR